MKQRTLAEASTQELLNELELRLQSYPFSMAKKIYQFIQAGYEYLPAHILQHRRQTND